jgi:hypothetical protein
MARLDELVLKVRSKNAGPFWLTIDIFCGSAEVFEKVSRALTLERVAGLYGQPAENVKRFEIPDLNVLKFSFPRPAVQGSRFDRDMHGAQAANILADLELDETISS